MDLSFEQPESETTEEDRKVEEEKQDILKNIASFKLDTTEHRVAWLLNHYPDTRNSDITLQLKYWEVFEGDIFNGISITPEEYRKLKRFNSISRSRAKIQNKYRLFQASDDVRQLRGTLSQEEKEKAREAQIPPSPAVLIFADESGKKRLFTVG